MSLGMRCENIEDQLGAIDHFDRQGLFQIPRLPWAKIVVEQHDIGLGMLHEETQFFKLSFAKVSTGGRFATTLSHRAGDSETGGCRQPLQFRQRIVIVKQLVGQDHAHQNARFAR